MRQQQIAPALATTAQGIEFNSLTRAEAAAVDQHVQGAIAGFQVPRIDAADHRFQSVAAATIVETGDGRPDSCEDFSDQDLFEHWSDLAPGQCLRTRR